MQQIKIEIYIINLDINHFYHIKSLDLSSLNDQINWLKTQ